MVDKSLCIDLIPDLLFKAAHNVGSICGVWQLHVLGALQTAYLCFWFATECGADFWITDKADAVSFWRRTILAIPYVCKQILCHFI